MPQILIHLALMLALLNGIASAPAFADETDEAERKDEALLADPALQAPITSLPGYAFKFSVATSASKTTIWSLWQDVENWTAFDTLLEYARLEEGARFENGAKGVLKASTGPRTRFTLMNIVEGESFVESLKLPLGHRIELGRYFEPSESGETIFTHQVTFKGPFKGLFYLALNRTFKKELRLVMGRLRDLAEAQ